MMRALVLWMALAPAMAWGQDGGAPDAGATVESSLSPQKLVSGGLAKLRGGDLEGAAAALREAFAKKPGSAAIATDLGYTLGKLGRLREAEVYLKRAMELDPKRPYAYANWAEVMAQSPDRFSRGGEVVARVEKGLSELTPGSRGYQSVTVALAVFERSLGRLSAARDRIAPLLGDPSTIGARARELAANLAADEAALALSDWPDPRLSPGEQQQVEKARALLDRGEAAAALPLVDGVLEKKPGCSSARFLRGQALATLSRFDEALSEISHLLQFRPSHAEGWRLFGTLLADHGGILEVDRASEALRRALVLEPSWEDLRQARVDLEKRRRFVRPAAPPLPAPTAKARDLYSEARRWMAEDAPELAGSLLEQALAESPDYVDAAVALFEVSGKIPAATPKALWNDGNALARLSEAVLRVRADAATLALVSPWLDRAMAKNADEAPFIRALWRARGGDASGALADLQFYVTRTVDPPRLGEARSLRASLEKPGDDVVTAARRLLLADKPREALAALGGPCRAGVPAPSLVELGRLAEYEGDKRGAVACYDLAASSGDRGTLRPALARFSLLAARLPDGDLPPLAKRLMQAKGEGLVHAHLALANLARAQGNVDEERAHLAAYLDRAPASDSLRPAADARWRALTTADRDARALAAKRLPVLLAVLGGLLLLLPLAWLRWRFRGAVLTKACRKNPDLFPELARFVGEIRHDLLKHRASALGMAGERDADAAIAQSLSQPERLSEALAGRYARLGDYARSLGVVLRPLPREPSLGPLWRDFRAAEAMLGKTFRKDECLALDEAFREEHGPALRALLAYGPRTPVDPRTVAGWIDLVRAEMGAAGFPSPAVHVDDLALAVPVPVVALATIVTNLLRNAAQASGSDGKLQIRVESQREPTGRLLVWVLVSDSAEAPLSLEDIEARDGQRGLGIARDTARKWGGRVVVRPESAPYRKSVGVIFPAAVEAA